VEALNKAYAGKGISFYYVLSREPHPGFYGFTQTDSLEMRQEYVRLANAELTIELPWIIDDMDNTMQKTYGGMPNSEFIIAPDGMLLESRDWADTDELKDWLETHIGPSGISDEQWTDLGSADQTARAVGNNDEVPATQVPQAALHKLGISRLDGEGALPITFEAATLPPDITADGQSRLYLVISPDKEQDVSFDKADVITLEISDVKGITLIKQKLKSGKRRSNRADDKDVYPHTLGVLWSLDEGQPDRMELKASVAASIILADNSPRTVTATYLISGSVPKPAQGSDEITADRVPSQVKIIHCQGVEEAAVPMELEAKIDAAHRMLYLYLSVEDDTGHHWNNLSAPPTVAVKALSGVRVGKTQLTAARRDGESDTDDRILAVPITLDPGEDGFEIEVRPEAWICHDDEGWCRLFAKTFKIKMGTVPISSPHF
jgi:hypothetical protein